MPMLALGVSDSGTTAVMIGVLTLYNIIPDPLLFQRQSDIIWDLIASLFVANVMPIVLNMLMVRISTRILAVLSWALVPAIAIIARIGVYSVHVITFDLFLMTGIGVLDYILHKLDFPLSPLLLDFILNELIEQNLRRALSISNDKLSILWSSSISLVTWTLVVMMLLLPLVRTRRCCTARHMTGLADA